MKNATSINSPCINICVVNNETGYCTGCYRTVPEIEQWLQLTANEKINLIQELNLRRLQDDPGY
jgi:predicted Fe-S protein YdhL (DUF1289 family)